MIRNWNPSQKPPQSSTTPTKEFEDMKVLCMFTFNVESWISENRMFGTFLTPLHHDQEPKPSLAYYAKGSTSETSGLVIFAETIFILVLGVWYFKLCCFLRWLTNPYYIIWLIILYDWKVKGNVLIHWSLAIFIFIFICVTWYHILKFRIAASVYSDVFTKCWICNWFNCVCIISGI